MIYFSLTSTSPHPTYDTLNILDLNFPLVSDGACILSLCRNPSAIPLKFY